MPASIYHAAVRTFVLFLAARQVLGLAVARTAAAPAQRTEARAEPGEHEHLRV